MRRLERLARFGEKGAGIGHRAVQPNAVKIVAQIIVLGDVPPARLKAVGTKQVERAVVPREQVEREMPCLRT